MAKSGDKKNLAGKKISNLILPFQEVKEFPLETLVVNPMDNSIPPDQKIYVFQPYQWGSQGAFYVIFRGGAIYIEEKEKTAYQIVMTQRDPLQDNKWMARFSTDTEYLDGNKIGLALDYMQETIFEAADDGSESLIDQTWRIIKEDMHTWAIAVKAGHSSALRKPWIVEPPIISLPQVQAQGDKFIQQIHRSMGTGRKKLGE